jgi:hypothetical protein
MRSICIINDKNATIPLKILPPKCAKCDNFALLLLYTNSYIMARAKTKKPKKTKKKLTKAQKEADNRYYLAAIISTALALALLLAIIF